MAIQPYDFEYNQGIYPIDSEDHIPVKSAVEPHAPLNDEDQGDCDE